VLDFLKPPFVLSQWPLRSTKKTAASKRKGIEGSARAVASPPTSATSTSDRNIALDSAISTTENPAPDPTPITSAAGNPATTTTKGLVPDNPGLVITDTAFTCDENSAITSTTKNPALRNPTSTAVNTTFACDTSNTTENYTLLVSVITKVTNNSPILSISATIIDKPSSLLAKVTNLVSMPNIGNSNAIIDDSTRITGLTIHNATPTIKPSDVLTYNSLAASLT
jgi:hypothetical protein